MANRESAKSYRRPPIEEALVEFRYVPERAWDPTIPGELYRIALLRDAYPGTPRTQQVFVPAAPTVVGAAPVALQESQRVQFLDHSGSRVLSVGADTVTVHVLRPYDGWSNFRPRIVSALEWCWQTLGFKSVSRVGLRYINRILLRNPVSSPEEYFALGPKAPSVLKLPTSTFLSRAEYIYGPGDKVHVTHATIPSQDIDFSAFLLDIDLSKEFSPLVMVTDVMPVVDILHQREGDLFEASITERLREVLDDQ